MSRASRLASDCHPLVAERHVDALARYARVTSACDALESFLGARPRMDDDVFALLSQRRAQIADLIGGLTLTPTSRNCLLACTWQYRFSRGARTNSPYGW